MTDFSFYNTDLRSRRFSWLLTPVRLVLRLLLRPIFLSQERVFEALSGRIDALTARQERLEALACDATALAHRLAALEDRLETLTRANAAGPGLSRPGRDAAEDVSSAA